MPELMTIKTDVGAITIRELEDATTGEAIFIATVEMKATVMGNKAGSPHQAATNAVDRLMDLVVTGQNIAKRTLAKLMNTEGGDS